MHKLLAQLRGQQAWQSGTGVTSAPAWAPPVDISERKDAYVVSVELPGVKVEDLEIAFQGGLLTIQGERQLTQDSADEQFHVLERCYGLFRRSITLPLHVQADAIEASTEDGVLQVVIPKVEEAKPRRIEVRAFEHWPPPPSVPRKALPLTRNGERPAGAVVSMPCVSTATSTRHSSSRAVSRPEPGWVGSWGADAI
ncbi:MAG TPA: Hsp20/alpha crystallin family protein [Pseudonocardiaceae bacterium]|nr:Hsp20/alpha crystallin family protein [Pseudonocardiaceae bacterium]